ncbi:MAG: hypothetical protein E7456_03780 [Ruminococcaceae bacterium]|nr:hypothetical protein [Oscillospiraceae bacterium]
MKKFILSVACTLVAAIIVLVVFSGVSTDVKNVELIDPVNAETGKVLDNAEPTVSDVHTSVTESTDITENTAETEISGETETNEVVVDPVFVGPIAPVIEEPEEPEADGRVIDPDKPMVALTFDDGPSGKYTESIIELLQEYDSVATFFELGELAEQYPEIIKKEVEAGCELGNHSYSHPNLTNLSESEAINQIEKTNDIFTEITGSPATVIRPPYGSISDRARLFNQPVVTWSIDTEDWKSRDADAIMNVIYAEEDLDGTVILMHSIYESSLEAARILVPYLIEEGYQLVTVSELYEYKYGEPMVGGELYGYSYFM